MNTRNKNTILNYTTSQRQNNRYAIYDMYTHSSYGEPVVTSLPGNGLNPGQFSRNALLYNTTDVESNLFGINSTNLVNPSKTPIPYHKSLPTIDLYDKSPVYMPRPIIHSTQRPKI